MIFNLAVTGTDGALPVNLIGPESIWNIIADIEADWSRKSP